MSRAARGFVLAFAVANAGCSGASSSQPARPRLSADDPSCPLFVAGTSVRVEDVTHGAALVFATQGDVFAVRSRAAVLADMHATRSGPASALGMAFPSSWTAIATEAEAGARVEFTVADAAGVAPLRQELRARARGLTAAGCGS